MKRNSKFTRYLIRVAKIVGWIILSVALLLVLISVAIQIPAIQNNVTQKAISFLEKKIGTEVRLDHISVKFPKKIVLTGLYLEDQRRDTLLYAGKLTVDTDLFALLKNKIDLNEIELDNFTAKVSRSEVDSAYNFDYILDAFATDTTAVQDTTAGWNFSIGSVALRKINVYLKDSLAGNDVTLRLGEMKLTTEAFDLTNSLIKIEDVNLADVKLDVLQNKLPIVTTDTLQSASVEMDSILFDFDFGEINLNNVQAHYSHSRTGQNVRVELGQVMVGANDINLQHQIIDLSALRLANSSIHYQQLAGDSVVQTTSAEQSKKPQTTSRPWALIINTIELSDNSIRYDNFYIQAVNGSVDYNHIEVTGLHTNATGISIRENEIQATLNNLSFREKNGFALESFSTSFFLDDNSINIRNFLLNSSVSKIALEASADFSSLQNLAQTYPEANLRVRILPSTIGLQDLLYFNPALLDSLPLNLAPSSTVRVEASVQGPVNDLQINRFLISALANTTLRADGHIRGLPDINKAVMQISLHKLYTTREDMQGLLPDTLLPQGVQLPGWINVNGQFAGSVVQPHVNTTLASDFGSVHLLATANLDSTVKENYKGELRINEFHVGKLLKQPETMGQLDMVASIQGAGLTIDDLDALVKLTINHFNYSGYDYRNFNLNGSLKRYFFSGDAFLNDENLDLEFHGGFNYNEDVPHYEFTFDLKNADFKALNLTYRPMKARGILDVNLNTKDFRVLNGNVDIRKFALYNGDQLYAVDSLLFASIDQEGRNEVSIRSDIISGDFKGTINLFTLPDVLGRHFNTYFSLRDTVYSKPLDDQNFKFELVLKNTELITEVLLPDLEPFVPGEISGEFNSVEDRLNVRVNLAEINYGGLEVDSVLFKLLSDKNSMDVTLAFERIRKDTMRIHEIRLAANIMNDSIRTNFRILDSLEHIKYFLGGVVYSFEDAFQFSFLQRQIVLNYDDWKVNRYNTLQFGKAGLIPNNFYIANGDSRILLVKQDDADSTMSVVFNEVDLKNISSVIEGTTPVGGFIDGDLNIAAAKGGSFNTNLYIKKLTILERQWGDLLLALGRASGGPLNMKLELEGENAEANIIGYTSRDSIPKIDFDAVIPRLDLSVIEPLTMGQLKNLKGELNAQAKITGTSADPQITGNISLRNVNFLSTYANSRFAIEDETIAFEGSKIIFDNFEILDSKKNIAKIHGDVSAGEEKGFLLNLILTARNFQLLNTTPQDNELFYGNIRINTDTKITGSSIQPRVEMNVSLDKDSEFTYVVPQSEAGVGEQKGIVVFVDKDAEGDPFMESINTRDTVKATFTGMELTANIELTDDETFNIIIDPVTGDKLSIKGNSTLALSMDPTGDMQISGRYEISEGTYDLSFYKLVKRNFTIEKGSYIIWSGDPLNADMEIRARYEVETSPIDLMANQSTEEDLRMYRQRLPFWVYLQIRGELLAPEISFELDMPLNQRNVFNGSVYAKIKDVNTRESDLNKQVFALLILKRFISDNPLESQAGSDVASTARRSASKLLTEQLNRLSQNVRGVELSFDVRSYEDYSTGEGQGQTELELGLSKTFLNDRLIVKVSGNVDLEGDASNQNSFTDYIGDLALEYKLTEDGRFRITGFRNSNYDMIDGELIETGAGLIYIKDYDTLRELFRSNLKQK